MRMPVILIATFALSTAWADNTDARSKLSGTWKTEKEAGHSETWVIQEKTDAVRLSYSTGSGKPTEIECNTAGRECEVKDEGKKATVSIWFNGPKLVVMETRGSEVVKRRFAVAPDGNSLELEVIPMVPPGKAETARFERAPEETAAK